MADNMEGAIKDGGISAKTHEGEELRGSLLRLSRGAAMFRAYNPQAVLRLSEVLEKFTIFVREERVYQGRATISNIIDAGGPGVCEVTLDEGAFDLEMMAAATGAEPGRRPFDDFLRYWQKAYKVVPEFKVATADMQTFLADLQLWLDHLELKRNAEHGKPSPLTHEDLEELAAQMVSAFNALHERLEDVSSRIDPQWRPIHQHFINRQLHPLVLCAPFAWRTWQKPLGYAGDYGMVNMILRDPFQGNSAYARIVNNWFLQQWPSQAHRNRVTGLTQRLVQETTRVMNEGRTARIFNLGCGPAGEIQRFLTEHEVSNHADFTLCDFNDETVRNTQRALEEFRGRFRRGTELRVQRRSVQRLLAEAEKGKGRPEKPYDLVYCAGLFDYLSDTTCRRLMNVFYDWVAPGGLVLATNVDDCKPFRHMLEFVLDWHLIYRGPKRAERLYPEPAPPAACGVKKDPTEVNIFIEARKPADAS